MKKYIKIRVYMLATLCSLLVFQSGAIAANGNSEGGSLFSSAEIVGGISILLCLILLPVIRRERRSPLN